MLRRVLRDDLLLDEGDEVLVQLIWGDLRHLKDLLVRNGTVLVEEEAKEHLEAGTEELVTFAFGKSPANLCVAQRQFPVEHATVVKLGVVKLGEGVHGHTDLLRDILKELRVLLIVWPVTLGQDLD